MVGVDEGRALRMDVRNYEGYDFIIIEQPDFERALKDGDTNNIPSDFHPGLSGYIRAKE